MPQQRRQDVAVEEMQRNKHFACFFETRCSESFGAQTRKSELGSCEAGSLDASDDLVVEAEIGHVTPVPPVPIEHTAREFERDRGDQSSEFRAHGLDEREPGGEGGIMAILDGSGEGVAARKYRESLVVDLLVGEEDARPAVLNVDDLVCRERECRSHFVVRLGGPGRSCARQKQNRRTWRPEHSVLLRSR